MYLTRPENAIYSDIADSAAENIAASEPRVSIVRLGIDPN